LATLSYANDGKNKKVQIYNMFSRKVEATAASRSLYIDQTLKHVKLHNTDR